MIQRQKVGLRRLTAANREKHTARNTRTKEQHTRRKQHNKETTQKTHTEKAPKMARDTRHLPFIYSMNRKAKDSEVKKCLVPHPSHYLDREFLQFFLP